MRQGMAVNGFSYQGPILQIRAIRSVQLTDDQFLMFGSRCLEVIGEP